MTANTVVVNETTNTVTVTQAPAASVVQVTGVGPQGPAYIPPRGVSIDTPSDSESITLLYLDQGATVSAIHSLVQGSGSPSVTFTLRWGPNRGVAGTEVVTGGTACTSTTGQTTTTLDEPAIPAGSWLWLETSATSGSVTTLHVTVTL